MTKSVPCPGRVFLLFALLFVVFATGVGAQNEAELLESARDELASLGLSELEPVLIIDLSQTDSASVTVLRDRWDIPVPEAQAVIVVSLKDPAKKEDYLLLKDTLRFPYEERVRETGKTYYGRFVLIDPGLSPDSLLSGREYTRVMNHELVHAYVMSLLGPERDRLPRWFHEGLATYLSNMGPRTASMEYRGFAQAFDWIDGTMGAEKLKAFVRVCLEEGRMTPRALAVIGVESEDEIGRWASSWQDTRRLLLVLPVFSALGLLLLLPTAFLSNPRRLIASVVPLWKAGIRNRHARRFFYSLDRHEMFPWLRNLRSIEASGISHAFSEDMNLIELRRASRKTPQDDATSESLKGFLRFLRIQPRPVRSCLWWMDLRQMSELLNLIEKWRGDLSSERKWRTGVRRLCVATVVFVAICCWALPRYTGRTIVSGVYWANQFAERLF